MTTTEKTNPIAQFRGDLQRMAPQFEAALKGSGVPVEKFVRVLVTAVQNDVRLLGAERGSLFNACMRAAQDGLLPDGRQGAITCFKDRKAGVVRAQWLAMIAGIRAKVLKPGGELIDFYQHVVHPGDEFEYQLGGDPFVHHKPQGDGGRTAPITHVYSVAVFRKGSGRTRYRSYDVMTIKEVEEIRKQYARSQDGPWNDPVAYPEMVRKTIARHHAKSLPMPDDVVNIFRRDDEDNYSLPAAEAHERPQVEAARPRAIAQAFDAFAAGPSTREVQHAGEVIDDAERAEADAAAEDHGAAESSSQPAQPAQRQPPTDADSYLHFVRQVVANAEAEGRDTLELKPWFTSPAQQKMRKQCGVDRGVYDQALAMIEGPANGE